MDLSCIKARVENHFYRRIDAIKHDLKYLYTNAASFNRPKSDIVRNAKVISNLAMEVVGGTTKTKDDVSSIYHGLVQNFQWSESEKDDDSDDEDSNDEKSDGANSTGKGNKNVFFSNQTALRSIFKNLIIWQQDF